jgi:predicted DNA-binding transcriptional regulator AlpA
MENENENPNIQATSAKSFGKMLSLSKRQIFRLNNFGKIPAPVKIGGSFRWRLSDVELWLKWNCPDRKTFEAMQQGENHAR